MRIYELAREAGVTSVEVLKAAEAAGLEATNAISSIEDGDAATLRAALSKAGKGDHESVRAKKRNLAAELNAKFFAEQRAKLEKHLAIAKAAAEGQKVTIEPPPAPVKPAKSAKAAPEAAKAAEPAKSAEPAKAAPEKAAPVPAAKPVKAVSAA